MIGLGRAHAVLKDSVTSSAGIREGVTLSTKGVMDSPVYMIKSDKAAKEFVTASLSMMG